MRQNATFLALGLALLCSAAVFAQGPANQQPYVPPAFDTYTPNIPGVVARRNQGRAHHGQAQWNRGAHHAAGWHPGLHGRGREAADAHRQRRQALDVPREHPVGRSRLRREGPIDCQRQYAGQAGDLHRPSERRRENTGRQEHAGLHGSNDLVVDKKGGVYFTQPEQANVGLHPPGREGDENRRRERDAPERYHHESRREDPVRERLPRRIPPRL